MPHLVQMQQKYGARGLEVVAISSESGQAAKVKNFVDQQNMQNFHVGISRALGGQWGVGGIPHSFVIDADGKVVYRGHPNGMDAKVEQALATAGPRISAADLRRLEEGVAAAQAAFDEGQTAQALAALDRLKRIQGDHPLKESGALLLAEIEKRGADGLRQAERIGDPVARHQALQAVARDYRGSSVGREAQSSLADLDADPAFKEKVAQQKAEEASTRLIAAAKRDLEAGELHAAYKSLQSLASNHPETAAGQEGIRILLEIEADPDKMKTIREGIASEEVQRVLTMARNYAYNGMDDRAIEKLRAFIEEYPDTSGAADAQAMIGQIERGEFR